jgi:predicted nucleic acid-binding protein
VITAVCDSNVYVSALVFGGMPREVVVLGEVGSIQLLASAALAIDGHADYLITGDNDLLVVGSFQTVRILSPADFCHEKPWIARSEP